MEPEGQRNSGFNKSEQEGFQRALLGAHGDVWWREYVKVVVERRARLMEELATGTFEQRQEDRLRGQISECAFTIALDKMAEYQLNQEKEKEHGRGEESPSTI